MATKMLEIQQKIYTALKDNTDLADIVSGIYDYVPENIRTPYVTFGQVLSTSLNTKIDNGETLNVFLEIWSESKGRKEAIQILTSIEEILETELEITTGTIVQQRVVNREVVEESYGLYHATVEIEFKVAWSY